MAERRVRNTIVRVTFKDGGELLSPPMPAVVADSYRHAIALRRDDGMNVHKHALPEPRWLPDDFDFKQVADVRTEYRDADA